MALEKKIRKNLSIAILILTVFCLIILYFFQDFHNFAVSFDHNIEENKSRSVLSFIREDKGILNTLSDTPVVSHSLKLELPENVKYENITFSENTLNNTFTLEIPGINDNYFTDYSITGSPEHIDDMRFATENGAGIIEFTFDNLYLVRHTMDGRFLCLDYVLPREFFDKIIVIDAGHGGSAPGATKMDTSEKDIDLAIVQKIKDDFDKDESALPENLSCENSCLSTALINDTKIGIYFTRTDDSNPGFEERVGLPNNLNADLFLSVHNNSTASGRMSAINGTEVMYKVGDETGASKAFAETVLSNLLTSLGSTSKGTVAGDDIFIIRTSNVPVCLAEIGFMTNQEELDKLKSDEYQKKAADALYNALLTELGVL